MIYVLGSHGQLGQEFKQTSAFAQANFLDRSAVDLSQLSQLEHFLQSTKITTLINAAAYTLVDKAETERSLATTINTEAPALIARYAQKKNFKFVHYSTDYVFNGEAHRPYLETDRTHPINFYGESKLMGENAIQLENPSALILRTSWVYSAFGNNFFKTMIRLGSERPGLKVVFDQVGTPTHARDLVEITQKALEADASGLYHFSNEGVASWYDFALAIFEAKGIKIPVEPIHSAEYPTPAKRPHYSVLDKTKIKKDLNSQIPHWRESLKRNV